ncbi:hypothetical protein BV22DRAFT_1195086 [Leucogyrophana mollusca]|uniref:Uncharacterized protein n=1 Tax=Leucogyrophana mollusca TaxID=85980 RepID=A0ACB8BI76_9AGAM|nr:hypothetical protein BV22DRAFT_1195086 [Leucogyrophana mollusca]
MKRTAEVQISKDNDGDDIEEVSDPGEGFRKADESVLATRQIRGLPRRSMAGSARGPAFVPLNMAPSPEDTKETKEQPATPKFGGFAGFGAAPASNSFTFTPPAAPAPAPAPTPSFSPFGATAKPAPSSSSPFSPISTVSSSASPATKSFASLLGPAPSAPAPPIVHQHGPSAAQSDDDAAALTYYKSLRGLNVSFLSAISSAVDKDPFIDIAGLLESYKNLRTTVQTGFDESSKSSKPADQVKPGSSSDSESKPKPSTPFAMPTAPTSFSGFGAASSTSNTSNGSGFTPSASSNGATQTSGFTFPPAPPSAAAANPSPFGFGSNNSSALPKPPSSGFSFPTASSTSGTSGFGSGSKESEDAGKSTSVTGSASSAFGSSIPNFFASSKPAAPPPSSDSTAKPSSAFGSTPSSTSLFGPFTGAAKPSSFSPGSSDMFKAAEKAETDKADPKPSGSSLFGNPTPSAFGTSPDKPASAFGGFGGGSPPKTSVFGFGKTGGSIGNPVGFGFGVPPPKASDGDALKAPAASGFSFGAPPKPAEGTLSPPLDSGGSTPQPEGAEDDSAKVVSSSNHDGEGEGEEDEETTHAARCKVYKMMKTNGKSEWKDMGIGMLRLKKHKETDARRVLLRNSATGKIILNFRVYAGLSPSISPKVVSFVGHDDGVSTPYKLRLKSDEDAQDLKAAMEREVEAISSE